MALTIKREQSWRRQRAIAAVWVVGILALVSAPFSQALTVHAPDKKISSITLSTTQTAVQRVVAGSSLPVTKNDTPTASQATNTISASPVSTNCVVSKPVPSGLSSAVSPELQKLAEYDQVCNSGIIGTMSFFTSIPTTTSEAQSYAVDVAAQLKEFAANGIQALVFLEPTTSSGGLIDMNTYESGAYDSAVDSYFADIKSDGVTDAMMGTWVPFPEGNIPVWTSVDPIVFTVDVTKTVTFQKKYFPASKATILLDSMTYPSAANWNNGAQVSLLPYVQSMPVGLLNSFGLQGFPWVPPASEGGPTNGEPQNYLQVDLAAQAARSLNVSLIWLNTGTFSAKYVGQVGDQVAITPARRLQLLIETVTQLKTLQAEGFQVALHLFAQDKSTDAEATNWSYWATGQSASSTSTNVFKSFVHELQAAGIPLWLFDTD